MTTRRILTVLVLAAAMAAFACGGGSDDDDDDTPTPPDGTATVSATSPPSAATDLPLDTSIRAVDVMSVPDVQAVVNETPDATVAEQDVIYADLTDDNVEEAVVPITSGGTAGNVAYVVLTPLEPDSAQSLLSGSASSGGGLALAVADGDLVVTEPVFGPDDAECCPSQLQHTTYAWDGEALTVDDQTVEPNPDAGPKSTPEN